jgi:hypothetical protein
VLDHRGGAAIALPLDGDLTWRLGKDGRLGIHYVQAGPQLPKGSQIHYRIAFAGASGGTPKEAILDFARKFGVAEPGKPVYRPTVIRGRQLDTHLVWRLDALGEAVEARVPKADMPGYLLAVVEGLRDGWSVWLVDRARKGPKVRGLPIRDGRAYAQLDLVPADLDLFIGHPVVCDKREIKLLVSWQEPGLWFVEAHNPTDEPVEAVLRSAGGWDIFSFKETLRLDPGTSRIWRVKGKE